MAARQTVAVEAPLYQVSTPSTMPDLLFAGSEYEQAYQHATGERIAEGGDDADGEENITIIDYDGIAEVPVADV